MFRSSYTLAEIARLLGRSEQAIRRDIEAGIFKVRSGSPMRRRGGDQGRQYEISQRDLEEYAEKRLAVKLPGRKPKEEPPVPERRPLEGQAKQCTSCGRLRPITDFTRDMRYKDGLSPVCTTCLRNIFRQTRD
jgi:hypothetical protein